MTLREFRLLSAPITLAAPIPMLPRGKPPLQPQRRRVTVARRAGQGKLFR